MPMLIAIQRTKQGTLIKFRVRLQIATGCLSRPKAPLDPYGFASLLFNRFARLLNFAAGCISVHQHKFCTSFYILSIAPLPVFSNHFQVYYTQILIAIPCANLCIFSYMQSCHYGRMLTASIFCICIYPRCSSVFPKYEQSRIYIIDVEAPRNIPGALILPERLTIRCQA